MRVPADFKFEGRARRGKNGAGRTGRRGRRITRQQGKLPVTDAISLTINGRTVEIDVHPTTPLLDVLRNSLGLTGTRFGCGEELCGACMVLIDGTPEYSCSRDIGTVAARAVVTIEGLGTPDAPHPVQQAILDEQAGQCKS